MVHPLPSSPFSNHRCQQVERTDAKELGSTSGGRKKHGLFRCGAFGRMRRPSIQNIRERYSDRVPQARIAGRLTSSRLVSSARTVVFY